MRLSLRQLHIFLAVVDTGSTTAAADRMALSQSATSAAINELESLLEAQLFDRVGKRLIINDNGRMILSQARQIIDTAHTIEHQFKQTGLTSGAGMRVGASTTVGTYLLPGMLAAAFAPGKQMPPDITIANTSEIVTAVANFTLDIGLIEGPCHDADLFVEPWVSDALCIVAAPTHPLLQGNPKQVVPKKALQDVDWLLREPGSGTREIVEHTLATHLHHVRHGGQFGSNEAIKHAAAQGFGFAYLSKLVVADFLESGRLVEVATPLPALRRHFSIIYHRRKVLSQRLEGFLALCRQSTGMPG